MFNIACISKKLLPFVSGKKKYMKKKAMKDDTEKIQKATCVPSSIVTKLKYLAVIKPITLANEVIIVRFTSFTLESNNSPNKAQTTGPKPKIIKKN